MIADVRSATKKPARRLASGSGALKSYVAFAAYYVDLLGGSDDGSVFRADILDVAVLAGAAATLRGDRGFAAVLVIVHHMIPLANGGTHNDSNLMSLCMSCHLRITAKEGGRWGEGRLPPPGGGS